MKEIKGKVKRAVQILWENKYRMTYYMLILCILFGCIHYAESGIWSSANISFNYSEASLGLSPNKTRFNAYEIVSEEVMQRAIEKVGLQGSISAVSLFFAPTTTVVGIPLPTSSAWEGPERTATLACGTSSSII